MLLTHHAMDLGINVSVLKL